MYLLTITLNSNAQLLKKLKDKAVSKTEQKAEAKVDHKIDAAVDSVMDGNIHFPKNKKASQNDSLKDITLSAKNENERRVDYEKGYVTKFDFIPGEKIIFFEDFSNESIGDFPSNWNTTGSGEIVTLNGLEGKWLLMQSQSNYTLNHLIDLPENATIQFDLTVSIPFEWRNEPIYFALADVKNPNNYMSTSHYSLNGNDNIVFWLNLHPGNTDSNAYGGYMLYNTSTTNLVNEKLDLKKYFMPTKDNQPLKVSIWKQKQRIRVYLNENKTLDLPKILPSEMKVNALVWNTLSLQGDNKYFISNIRVAAGNPDTRNKLISDGKLVSSGIQFGINSNVIKPESYGILKEIAEVLKENKTMNINIVGHTDDDGDEVSNLTLSQKRAIAVKTMLSQEFGIDALRMETDGKGEKEPILPNTSAINKASNRRVEFIRIN